MSHTYFAATLPALQFDAEPPMTREDFRGRCREHLGAADFAAVCALLDGGETASAHVNTWRQRDTQLRNASAQHRAARLGDGGAAARWQRPHTGFDVATEHAVDAAFQEANPLRRNDALERIRWNLAGELAGFDPFSIQSILAYAIRLGILLRRTAADAEKGAARLKELMNVQAASEE